jgi:hypothetical protein
VPAVRAAGIFKCGCRPPNNPLGQARRAHRLWNEFFFSAPQLRRIPLGRLTTSCDGSMNSRVLPIVFIVALLPLRLSAQRLEAPLPSWTPTITASLGTNSPSRGPGSRDYRFEGTLIGAAILGAVGYWVGHEACTNQPEPAGTGGRDCGSDALLVALVGGAVGAGLGYILGRSISKP